MARIIFYIKKFHLTTSPNSCQCTTLLNTKVLNFYITHKQQLINGCTEIHFIEPGVKVNRAYYRDNLLAKKLLPDKGLCRKSQGLVLSFNRTVHWRIDTVALLQRKVPNFVSLTLWSLNSPGLNPDDHSIWSVGLMQGKVYQSRISNVNEFEMRLIDELGRLDQSILDAAITASGASSSACVRGAGHTSSTKHKVSAILSCICQKVLN